MLWKLFGSEQAVQNAINQSVGYDISPTSPQMPANTDEVSAPVAKTEEGKPQFYFMAPWNEKQG